MIYNVVLVSAVLFSFIHDFFVFQIFYSYHVLSFNYEKCKKEFNTEVFMGKKGMSGICFKIFQWGWEKSGWGYRKK